MKNRQQAWHMDTYLPGVYVNIIYLDDDSHMTMFLCPKSVSQQQPAPNFDTLLYPIKIDEETGDSIVSDSWRAYLKEK